MLPAVQVAPNSTTVSGYSYGGDMAVQVHVAFSKTIKGVCGFAAQPVYCAATLFTREAQTESAFMFHAPGLTRTAQVRFVASAYCECGGECVAEEVDVLAAVVEAVVLE